MISSIRLHNYRFFSNFTFDCNPGLNIVVGNNDSGKSTILEAINLALTGRLNGRPIESELSPYLFNDTCRTQYLTEIRAGGTPDLPTIRIELFFADEPAVQVLRGTNNSDEADVVGICLEVMFDEDCRAEYSKLLEDRSTVTNIPIEYYKVTRYAFSGDVVSNRNLPARVSYIDATTMKLHSGTDHYMQSIINSGLDTKERIGLSFAYRGLKEAFAEQPAILDINAKIAANGSQMTDKSLKLGIDLTSKGAWDVQLIPHLNDIPIHYAGKGEQHSLKILLALTRNASDAHVILVEEPENHLSHSSLNVLISRISKLCAGKQLFVTTHSAFVLNKLGIDKVVLLHDQQIARLDELTLDTEEYFQKLPGYDTLRLILSKMTILVEGPSDELIVQAAYRSIHGKLPIEGGIDVLSVRALSFVRFLEIARLLRTPTAVVTDNDGNYARKVESKYANFVSEHIRVFASDDNTMKTLEDHMVELNDITLFNEMLGRNFAAKEDLLAYMKENKTEWALAAFDLYERIVYPRYILDAVA